MEWNGIESNYFIRGPLYFLKRHLTNTQRVAPAQQPNTARRINAHCHRLQRASFNLSFKRSRMISPIYLISDTPYFVCPSTTAVCAENTRITLGHPRPNFAAFQRKLDLFIRVPWMGFARM